jgi:hypothetical protein
MRTTDLAIVKAATDPWADDLRGFWPEAWLAVEGNVALTNENGDVALFERHYLQPHSVFGHYFFHSRGIAAYRAAVEFLEEAFTGPYDIETIMGLTPHTKKGALGLNTKLGFTSLGTVETPAGPCEMVFLTKPDWESK